MALNLLSFFATFFVTQLLLPKKWRQTWFFILSLFCLVVVNDAYLGLAFFFVLLNELIKVFCRHFHFDLHKYVPFLYAFVFIFLHHIKGAPIVGASYLILAASLDLVDGKSLLWQKGFLKKSFFNLVSFPKASMGPIQSAQDHFENSSFEPKINLAALKVGLGTLKVFILLPLFRDTYTIPFFKGSQLALDFLGFGLWNYIILYLEFSGICDLVMAIFFVAGFSCLENFKTPYLSLSITDFWKRWHASLGHWIRKHIYFPLGGNRKGTLRLYFNLIMAMVVCGAWHGLSWNYLGWGALQGGIMAYERYFGWEKWAQQIPVAARLIPWLVTQLWVIVSWSIFFSWSG